MVLNYFLASSPSNLCPLLPRPPPTSSRARTCPTCPLPTRWGLGLSQSSDGSGFTDYLPATLKRNGSLHPPEGDGREGGAAVEGLISDSEEGSKRPEKQLSIKPQVDNQIPLLCYFQWRLAPYQLCLPYTNSKMCLHKSSECIISKANAPLRTPARSSTTSSSSSSTASSRACLARFA